MTEVKPVVEHIESLRFRVRSDSRPEMHHLVDLTAYWGVGWCDCEDFKCHKEPEVSKGIPSNPEDFACKHIKAARKFAVEFLGSQCLDRLMTENRTRAYANGETEPWA